MNLTTEEQKLLTQFLGECWHEWPIGHNYTEIEQHCLHCAASDIHPPKSLDFTDWRVVGRLVEKLHSNACIPTIYSFQCLLSCQYKGDVLSDICDTPQEAICRAALAYLAKEKP